MRSFRSAKTVSKCAGEHRLQKVGKAWPDTGGIYWAEYHCSDCHCVVRIRGEGGGRREW